MDSKPIKPTTVFIDDDDDDAGRIKKSHFHFILTFSGILRQQNVVSSVGGYDVVFTSFSVAFVSHSKSGHILIYDFCSVSFPTPHTHTDAP